MIFEQNDRVKVTESGATGTVIGYAHSIGPMYVVAMDREDGRNEYQLFHDDQIEKLKEN